MKIEATGDFHILDRHRHGDAECRRGTGFIDPDAANFPQRFYRTRDSQSAPQSLPPPQLQIHRAPDGQIMLSATGPAGHTYDIEATEDFMTWTVIATATLGAGDPMDFTDTNAPNFSQRFYRLAEHPPSQQSIHSRANPGPGPVRWTIYAGGERNRRPHVCSSRRRRIS